MSTMPRALDALALASRELCPGNGGSVVLQPRVAERGDLTTVAISHLEELQWRLYPPAERLQAAERARGELLTLAGGVPSEMEFALPVHVVLMFPDGCSGEFEVGFGEESRRFPSLAVGALFFNPAHNYLRIRTKARGHCRVLLIAIDPDTIERLGNVEFDVSEVEFHQEIDLNDEAVRRTLNALKDEIEQPGPVRTPYCHILTMLLLTQLIRCASNLASPRRPTYIKGGLPNWRLKRALEALNGGWNKAPTLAELASGVGLHPSSFCRAFKQSTRVSPHRYLLERRIARAKEMMVDQTLALTQIALECGFNDSSHFSVAFRKLSGVAPRIYRNSL